MIAGRSGAFRLPVPAFLVEHPRGLVLFDTGLHPTLTTSGERLRSVADIFTPEVTEAEVVSAHLRTIGIDPADIAVVVSSHLHLRPLRRPLAHPERPRRRTASGVGRRP
jgi:N-acyl homoserine lactone hydrolase